MIFTGILVYIKHCQFIMLIWNLSGAHPIRLFGLVRVTLTYQYSTSFVYVCWFTKNSWAGIHFHFSCGTVITKGINRQYTAAFLCFLFVFFFFCLQGWAQFYWREKLSLPRSSKISRPLNHLKYVTTVYWLSTVGWQAQLQVGCSLANEMQPTMHKCLLHCWFSWSVCVSILHLRQIAERFRDKPCQLKLPPLGGLYWTQIFEWLRQLACHYQAFIRRCTEKRAPSILFSLVPFSHQANSVN